MCPTRYHNAFPLFLGFRVATITCQSAAGKLFLINSSDPLPLTRIWYQWTDKGFFQISGRNLGDQEYSPHSIRCMNSNAILVASVVTRGLPLYLLRFFKFQSRGSLKNNRSTFPFLIPDNWNGYHNNQLSTFFWAEGIQAKMPPSTPVPSLMLYDAR